MNFLRSLLLACGVAFLGTGCVSSARRLEVVTVRKILPGTTLRADVEKLLGPPSETITGSNGKSVARYFFREYHRSSDSSEYERQEHPGDILLRTLSLRYGAGPEVEQKLHDESITPVRRLDRQFSAGPVLTPEALVAVRKGVTSATELVGLYGEPTARTFDANGNELLIWFSLQYMVGRAGADEVRQLLALLDENHTLQDYSVLMRDLDYFYGRRR